MDEIIGKIIGERYEVIESLGQGGMARVYKAKDNRLGRPVAIKVMQPNLQFTADFLKRFEREAKSLAQITHPHIIPVLDYGKFQEMTYLVMEFFPGGTLNQKMTGPLPYQSAIKYLLPVARALSFCHSNGIIHRDIKPANILLTKNDEPMLADFGVAKLLASNQTQLTLTGSVIGTPAYMAPEQGQEGVVTPQTDVYALGVILYEMICGVKPHQADTPISLMLKKVNEPVLPPSAHHIEVPQKIEELLIKSLAIKPTDRYQSMDCMIKAMESALTIKNHPRPTHTTVVQPPTKKANLKPAETTFEPIKEQRIKQTKSVLPLLGVIITAIAIITTIFIYVNQESQMQANAKAETPTPSQMAAKNTMTSTVAPSSTHTSIFTPTKTMTSLPTITPTLGIGSSFINEKDQMPMVYVPAGEFIMGMDSTEHSIYLDSYWIDQTEVTNAMFQQFFEETGYITDAEKAGKGQTWKDGDMRSKVEGAYWANPQFPDYDFTEMQNHPVVLVSWNDANAYCEWAGRRLPTEAEWEKAARGIDGDVYPWGNREPMDDLLNFADASIAIYSQWIDEQEFDDGYAFTAPVGSYPSGMSPYGAYDMVGNVWEWVYDWWDEYYYDSPITENPTGPETGTLKMIHGGSWYNSRTSEQFQVASRVRDTTDAAFAHIGFRCAMSIEP